MWAWHDRLEDHISEETCREEIESFTRYGQLIAALGRPLINDPDHDVELIYGARRLFVAQHLNLPLLVEVRDMSDRDAIVAMDIENRQRVDISPYERGVGYSRWLRAGQFRSQDELASSLRISRSQVSRLLKLARLPAAVVSAFGSPAEICEGWGIELVDCLEDPRKRQCVLESARLIASGKHRLPAKEAYLRLISAATRGRKLRPRQHDQVVKGPNGAALFRVRVQTDTVAVLLPAQKVAAPTLQRITEAIAMILGESEVRAPAVRISDAKVAKHAAMASP
jgi:ParB family chromosome partitioning protein